MAPNPNVLSPFSRSVVVFKVSRNMKARADPKNKNFMCLARSVKSMYEFMIIENRLKAINEFISQYFLMFLNFKKGRKQIICSPISISCRLLG